MIRITKSEKRPLSLTTTNAYDGEDVKSQLFSDQHSKCYFCERKVSTDFQIDHLESCQNYPQKRIEWTNLLLSCNYCNQKKGCRYDGILNPLNCNVEDIVEQRINHDSKTMVFKSNEESQEIKDTINLLESVFNGNRKLRKWKERMFYNKVEELLNRFDKIINAYKYNPTPKTEQAVRDELSIDKELLGFKYWIIKDNPQLLAVFGADIKWNKP